MSSDFTTLIELVRCYSPSGQEAPAVEYLVQRMAELGFGGAYSDEVGNAIGVMGTGPRQIVLLGHIDTVPGEIPVRVEGGSLHGRGSVDAKGPLAAFVDATARLGVKAGWQVVVIGAVDEERQSLGARHIVDKFQPDFAVIGEPSRWQRLALGYKGVARAEITVTRPVAHTAAQNETAPEAAVGIWDRIQAWAGEFNAGRERAFEQVTPSLQAFASQAEAFQETATLCVGARLPLGVTPSQWYDHLREMALPKGGEVHPLGFPIPAYRADKNTPLVRAFLGAIRAAGGKPAFVVKTGTADLNIVAPVWGCPAVVYGPGDSNLDHTPDEHLALDEYTYSVQVLTTALQRLTSRRAS